MGHQYRTFYLRSGLLAPEFQADPHRGLRWEIYFPEAVNGKDNGGFADLKKGPLWLLAREGRTEWQGPEHLKAFAPRVSLAYELDSKTVLRMGYGRSFDLGVFGSNFGHAVTQNLPVLAAQAISRL